MEDNLNFLANGRSIFELGRIRTPGPRTPVEMTQGAQIRRARTGGARKQGARTQGERTPLDVSGNLYMLS
jgi:hypothetical protein